MITVSRRYAARKYALTRNEVYEQQKERLRSLDALRGFDMFWIISGEGIFHGIASAIRQKYSLVQNPADWQIILTEKVSPMERLFVFISNQLHHSPWNGFTFYDMIFPLFIFIAGVSMPFSFSRWLEAKNVTDKKQAKQSIYMALLRRTIILILLGMIVNGLLQWEGYENTRFASVLGRIGLACFFAAIIYLNTTLWQQISWFVFFLLGYWALMILVPVPGYGAGVLTPEGNLAGYIDRLLLPGKIHRQFYDPEGLLSTMPSIATALLGIFTGQFLYWNAQLWSKAKKGAAIMAAGMLLLGAGLFWNLFFPINKNMWTSSFVLYAGGWSLLLFGIFYLVIDVTGFKTWSQPFVWIGMNSILIYVAAHGLIIFESTSLFVFGGLINKTPALWHQAFLWAGVAVIQLALLYFLYRKKWFLKL